MTSSVDANSAYTRGRAWIDMPQSNSLASDIFVFIAGGMNLAISLGWSYDYYNLHFRFCWFIGVAIGAVIAAPLVRWKSRRIIMIYPRVLILISGIVAASADDALPALLVSRYLNGIGIGFTTVNFIVHASEIASEHHRGFCMSFEQVGLASGAYLQMLYTGCWSADTHFSPSCLLGIFCIVFSVIAFCLGYFIIDSPILYLLKGDEPEALGCLVRLYRPPVLTNDKQALLVEYKEYVAASEQQSWWESFVEGLLPLLKLLLYRAMLAFINALPLSIAVEVVGLLVSNTNINWPPIVYGYAGLLGTLIAMYTLGAIGRKLCSLISLLIVAALLIGLCVLFHSTDILLSHSKLSATCALLMIAQLVGNIYAPSTTVYLGEAFPLRWKPYFIALCVIMQYMIDLVIVCTFAFVDFNMYVYCLATGVICFCCFWVFCFTMPETKYLKLWDAQQQLANTLNLGCY